MGTNNHPNRDSDAGPVDSGQSGIHYLERLETNNGDDETVVTVANSIRRRTHTWSILEEQESPGAFVFFHRFEFSCIRGYRTCCEEGAER